MERQERALNMSKNTKQVKVMVVSRGVIILSSIWGGGGGGGEERGGAYQGPAGLD